MCEIIKKMKKLCAHIYINCTDRGCMTCGEKQEMHYHRYLSLYSLVVVAPRNLRNPLGSATDMYNRYGDLFHLFLHKNLFVVP